VGSGSGSCRVSSVAIGSGPDDEATESDGDAEGSWCDAAEGRLATLSDPDCETEPSAWADPSAKAEEVRWGHFS